MLNNVLIQQNTISEMLYARIIQVYYGYWSLYEAIDPMIDHTIFVTYRVFDDLGPRENLMDGFRRWYRGLIKEVAVQNGRARRRWVQQRKPVGMFAMDYAGSRDGRWSDSSVGAHIHAILVLHPDLAASVKHQLRLQQMRHRNGLYWEEYRNDKPVRDTVHYCLNGIMHQNGFYQGRDDRYDMVEPNLSVAFSKEG